MLPIQSLRIVVTRVTRADTKVQLSVRHIRPIPKLRVPENFSWIVLKVPKEYSWMPGLTRRLSHEWLSAGRFQEHAAMADDSEPPKFLWNLRCSLPLEQCAAHPTKVVEEALEKIRNLVLFWQARRLYLELIKYLTKTYSNQWQEFLVQTRACFPTRKRRRTRGVENMNLKRRRVVKSTSPLEGRKGSLDKGVLSQDVKK